MVRSYEARQNRSGGGRTASVQSNGPISGQGSQSPPLCRLTEFPQVGIQVMSALAAQLHRTTRALIAAQARLGGLEQSSGG